MFSFKTRSLISSECTRNLVSSLNTKTCNPVLGSHMEDFQKQITAMYFEKNYEIKYFFQQKRQTLQDLTQSLNLAAVRCLRKI